MLNIQLDNADLYRKVIEDGLPYGADLTLVTLDDGTNAHAASVVLTFTVETLDGTLHRAQATTTVKLLLAALQVLAHRYDSNGMIRSGAPKRPAVDSSVGPGNSLLS